MSSKHKDLIKIGFLSSSFLSPSPRIQLRELDSMTGSYPTIARTGDRDRLGNFGSFYDDSVQTVFYTSASNLLYPDLIHSSSILSFNAYINPLTSSVARSSGSIVALGTASKDTINNRARFISTPSLSRFGEKISPFVESRIYIDDHSFYSGSMDPHVTSSLKSKVQIRINMSPNEVTTLSRNSVSRNHDLQLSKSDGTFTNDEFHDRNLTGFAYYNFADGRWEEIGLKTPGERGNIINYDYSCRMASPGGAHDPDSIISGTKLFPMQFMPSPQLAETPGGIDANNLTASLSYTSFTNVGTTSIHCFSPFSTKYHATASQTLKMSDYITEPILVEAITVELPIEARRIFDPGNSTTTLRSSDDYVFFIYRQTKSAPSYARPPGFDNKALYVSGSERYLVCSGVMTFYNSSVRMNGRNSEYYNFSPANSPAFKHDWRVSAPNSAYRVASYTGSARLKMRPAIANAQFMGTFGIDNSTKALGGQHVNIHTYWPGGTSTRPFFESIYNYGTSLFTGKSGVSASYGRATFVGLENSASLGNVRGLLPIEKSDYRTEKVLSSQRHPLGIAAAAKGGYLNLNGITDPEQIAQSDVCKYLLFPEDELVFGIDALITPGQTGSLNTITGSLLKIASSASFVTIFGSLLNEGAERSLSLNQNLTTPAVHESIHLGSINCSDQFDISHKEDYFGSYIERSSFGRMSKVKPAAEYGRQIRYHFSVDRLRFDRYIDYVPDYRVGSFCRFVRHIEQEERYYDSIMPAIKQWCQRAGGFNGISVMPGRSRVEFVGDYWYAESGSNRMPFPYEFDPDDVPRSIEDNTHITGKPLIGSTTITSPIERDMLLFKVGYGHGSDNRSFIFPTSDFSVWDGMPDGIELTIGHHSTGSSHASGFRYGIANTMAMYESCVFRWDRYGQFRDMLEQRKDTKFYLPSNADGGGEGTAAVQVKFVEPLSEITVDPMDTVSSNVSFEATSSLPYFDQSFRNRTIDPDDYVATSTS